QWLDRARTEPAVHGNLSREFAFAEELITAFGEGSGDQAPVAAQRPKAGRPSLVEALSERELEVLRHVAAGLSNQQAAERLVVTVGTVKKHLANIYGKLGVESRTQALVRAKALQLLE
ncbi:MAG TPA: LuxR C-terminal-related transcriptional regulator, partial [Caldilineaceae bacterium]|nr:LuxR C-terminal-related transcriptional regulator [Caldilineaceae bacterium]